MPAGSPPPPRPWSRGSGGGRRLAAPRSGARAGRRPASAGRGDRDPALERIVARYLVRLDSSMRASRPLGPSRAARQPLGRGVAVARQSPPQRAPRDATRRRASSPRRGGGADQASTSSSAPQPGVRRNPSTSRRCGADPIEVAAAPRPAQGVVDRLPPLAQRLRAQLRVAGRAVLVAEPAVEARPGRSLRARRGRTRGRGSSMTPFQHLRVRRGEVLEAHRVDPIRDGSAVEETSASRAA